MLYVRVIDCVIGHGTVWSRDVLCGRAVSSCVLGW